MPLFYSVKGYAVYIDNTGTSKPSMPLFYCGKGYAVYIDNTGTSKPVLYCANPPGGSWWIISVGDYAYNSFAALGSGDPREVRLELLLGFYVFHFLICSSPFCFLLPEFNYTFPCLIKYYHIMFINILPQENITCFSDSATTRAHKSIRCESRNTDALVNQLF